ncbi:uncharacterized protein [Acropora muricata]|uniref:uncharacterized protein isoform X1 n=1 Tax=Acropora muricata TaxID=159855 RepID=UPI0034E38446
MKMFSQMRKAWFMFILLGIILIALEMRLSFQRIDKAKEGIVSRRDSFSFSTVQTEQDNSANVRQTKKFYIAFSYWEQMTMATTNLLALAALAVHSGRQVVVPFVHNSKFKALKDQEHVRSPTLDLYFNLTALNNKLRSHGYNDLASFETFQDVCQGKLDLLIYFNYGKETTHIKEGSKSSILSFFSSLLSGCRHEQVYRGFQVAKTVCVDVGILKSTKEFIREVLKGSPCTGIVEWRGNGSGSDRANFPLPPTIHRPLFPADISFFNETLLDIAHNFSSKALGSEFISVHLRTEGILHHGGSITMVVNCLKELAVRIQQERDRDQKDGKAMRKVFVAADFSPFGSRDGSVSPARKNSKLLIDEFNKQILNPNLVFFDPHAYNIVDTGSVAIVEINILISGGQYFCLGGRSFQDWTKRLFVGRKNHSYADVHNFCTD